jgi:putative methanogenesis marker protein 8
MPSQDEHILEAIGRSRIVIREGKVVEVGPSAIDRCPLAARFAKPVLEITPEAVKENIEHRIRSFGMCTPGREVYGEDEFVGFGASELISGGLRVRLLDAAVLVCDGAGTVVAPSPGLVQGIGGRMSGLVKTSPLRDVIRRIERYGGVILDRSCASIDQAAGTDLAFSLGFSEVAVTVADPAVARQIRSRYPGSLIFAVHSTGLTPAEAGQMVQVADIVTACASGAMREAAGKFALIQAGTAVPIFAITERGRELILAKLRSPGAQFLVQAAALPFQGPRVPDPLR